MSHHKLMAMTASAVVLLAVLVGLYLAGSPADERLRRLDELRIQDLMALNAAIDLQIRRNNSMPANLASVVDGQRLITLPTDPDSGAQYEFSQLSSSSYELCAVFAAATAADSALNFWAHPAGRACFTFQVNADTVLQ